jgi:hypothetical protein
VNNKLAIPRWMKVSFTPRLDQSDRVFRINIADTLGHMNDRAKTLGIIIHMTAVREIADQSL